MNLMNRKIDSFFVLLTLTGLLFLLFACDSLGTKDSGTSDSTTDSDGNSYNTVTIGTQVWMGANLKTTKFSDGTSIRNVKGGLTWSNLSTPAYCWPDNDSVKYKNVVGALYNWVTVSSGKLCPTGWHVPSKDEFTTLETYLGGYTSGGKLKGTNVNYWGSPLVGATDDTGFSAYSNGLINSAGSFFSPYTERSLLWSSSVDQYGNAFYFQLYFTNTNFDLGTFYGNKTGMGVRCLKN